MNECRKYESPLYDTSGELWPCECRECEKERLAESPKPKPPALRCSSLPRVAVCPASAQIDAFAVDTSSDVGRLGSAVHAIQQTWIQEQATREELRTIHDLEDLLAVTPGLAAFYEVDAEELGKLAADWWYAWRKIAAEYPNPRTEMFLATPELTGHIDVLSLFDDQARILDLKTGFRDKDYAAQLKGYAHIVLANHPEVETVFVTTLWLRDHSTEGKRFTRAEIAAWWTDLQARVAAGAETYRPGDACTYCPRSAACPAKTAYLAQAVATLEAVIPGVPATDWQLALIEGGRGGKWLDRIKAVEEMLDMARKMIKAVVAEQGGRLATDDGRELVLSEQTRTEINAPAAWRLLPLYVGDRREECIKIVKGDLERLVKDEAPRGRKNEIWQHVLEELDDAGALERRTSQRLDLRRIALPLTGDTANG